MRKIILLSALLMSLSSTFAAEPDKTREQAGAGKYDTEKEYLTRQFSKQKQSDSWLPAEVTSVINKKGRELENQHTFICPTSDEVNAMSNEPTHRGLKFKGKNGASDFFLSNLGTLKDGPYQFRGVVIAGGINCLYDSASGGSLQLNALDKKNRFVTDADNDQCSMPDKAFMTADEEFEGAHGLYGMKDSIFLSPNPEDVKVSCSISLQD